VCLSFLQDQSRSGDVVTLTALASVLSHAPVDFILDQFDLTCRLIERASTLGEPCYRELEHKLLDRAQTGIGEGDWHSTVPQGKERLERAFHCRSRTRLGSAAYSLYSQLCERLEAQPQP
jgi:hypothetical protein